MISPGIRARVLWLAILPAAFISVVLVVLLTADKVRALDQSLQERAAAIARNLAPATEYGVSTGNVKILSSLLESVRREADVKSAVVFSSDGRIIAQVGQGGWAQHPYSAIADGNAKEFVEPHSLYYYAAILRTEVPVDDFRDPDLRTTPAAPRRLGWVGLEVSRAATLRSQHRAILQSLAVLLAGLAVSALIGWRMGRQISRPILALARTVGRIGGGYLNERAETGGGGEIGLLQQGINAMAARLQSMHEQMQERIDQATARLAYQASHDALTGLVNRREFEQRLERAVVSSLSYGRTHALCYMDLDQFKVINDTCGHAAGDELLRQLALILKNQLRHRDTLARLGGDEFALLLENCSPEDALHVADGFRAAVDGFRFKWGEKIFSVGMSQGLVMVTPTGGSAANLLSAADAACYVAKDKGRNQIHVYEPRDLELARHRSEMQWVGRIQRALEEDRLHLYWQEVVPLGRQDGRHVEFLLRMIEDDGSLVLPMSFIPAAERYGLMPQLDRWVIEKALGACRSCLAGVHGAPVQSFAINLSGASLKDPEFRQMLYGNLRDAPDIARTLCFEITETAAIGNLVVVNQFMGELRAFGCRFSLDDFGSGLSSFNYLRNLKVDYLKIDGNFVRNLEHDAVDRSMVESIHRLGKLVGLKTIAEFVESEAALEILRAIGLDYVQGNHLHEAEPLATLCRQAETARPLAGTGFSGQAI